MSSEAGHFDFEGARFGVRMWAAGAASAKRQDSNPDTGLDQGRWVLTPGQSNGASRQDSSRRTRNPGGGKAGSPFVLLHGFAQSSRSWKRVAPALAHKSRANVYALDLVGHGESARPDADGFYDIGFQARAVLAFCASVAQSEGARPVLVGYSMGGRVALRAAEHVAGAGSADCTAECAVGAVPDGLVAERAAVGNLSDDLAAGHAATGGLPGDRAAGHADENAQDGPASAPFCALVLESAGLGPADSVARDALAKRNGGWAARLREEGVAPFMEYWGSLSLFESQRSLDSATRAEVAAERLSNGATSLALTFERAGAHAMPPRSEAVRALRKLTEAGVSATYLAGALDAKYRAVAKSLASDLGRAIDVRIVPNAGHNTHLEQPEAFVSELLGGIAGK